MVLLKKWVVTWEYEADSSFLFGSEIEYIASDKVKFRNRLLPPGEIIKIWKSKLNYQVGKVGNILPILTPEKKYWICLNIHTKKKNSILLKIEFYNRFDEVISYKIIQNSGEFIYPDNCLYYNLILMNNGVEEFVFNNIIISESNFIEDIQGYHISSLRNNSHDSTALTIIFSEPIVREIATPEAASIRHINDTIIISSSLNEAHLYLEEKLKEYLLNTIEKIKKEYEVNRIRFIGYGPISNFAAVFYTQIIENSYGVVTDEWHSEKYYNSLIEKYDLFSFAELHNSKAQKIDSSKIIVKEVREDIENSFSKIIDRSNILINIGAEGL